MIDLCDEIMFLQFGEDNYVYESRLKLELILDWVCDSVAIFKKENNLLINSNLLIIKESFRIDVIVGEDHSQGAFRFPMKILFVMNSGKTVERLRSVPYVLCKKYMFMFMFVFIC